MLENLLTKIGKPIIKSHPSANRLFATGSSLEKVIFIPSTKYTKFVKENHTEDQALKVSAEALKLATYATYLTLETASRLSETMLRGTIRATRHIGKKVYGSFDQKETSGFKKFFNKIGKGYRSLKQKLKVKTTSDPQGRRQFVKDSLVVAGSLYFSSLLLDLTFSGNDEEPRSSESRPKVSQREPVFQPHDRLEPEQQRNTSRQTNPVTNFSDDSVLVYCANEQEKNYVLETLKDRNNLRSRILRMNFNSTSEGATKVTLPNLTMDGSIKNTEIYIVNSDYKQIPQREYDLIQLRGHTNDMLSLFEETKDHQAANVTYLLGGCDSDQFIDSLSRDNVAVIAGQGIQNGSQNTYMLVRVIDELGKVDSWNQLSGNIKSHSVKARDFVFPGEANYSNN